MEEILCLGHAEEGLPVCVVPTPSPVLLMAKTGAMAEAKIPAKARRL